MGRFCVCLGHDSGYLCNHALDRVILYAGKGECMGGEGVYGLASGGGRIARRALSDNRTVYQVE